MVAAVVLATAGAASAAQDMPVSQDPLVPGAPPPPAAAPATAPATAAPRPAASGAMRVGASGPRVRALQRALRRRGLPIVVDGGFGAATRRAVRVIQGRLGLPATGVADTRLLERLGIRVRTAAAAGAVVAPAPGRYVRVFPVAGATSYSDDWGAPRPQGGHEGTDILADRHTPVVAAADAVIARISRVETGRGGVYLWLRRSDGIQFYYAHMQSIVDGLALGSRVAGGQVVGAVGNSGDARYGPTHLHFEIRREWTPFNPYPELVAADPEAVAVHGS